MHSDTGAVAAGHHETADTACEILRSGDNAFDAALGAFLTACVAEPVLASLGGGGFLTAARADGAVEVFDFFTQTPHTSAVPEKLDFSPIMADFGTAQQEFHCGLGAVAVPGAVAGIFAVHEALGRMPLTEIAQPALALAASGLRMNAFQCYLLGVVGPIYVISEESIAQFCRPDGTLLGEGDVYRPQGFEDFLDTLVHEGPRLFYEGEVAQAIAGAGGGSLGLDDLAAYKVARRTPLHLRVGVAEIAINPPPAIGGAMIAAMLHEISKTGRYDAGTTVAAMRVCNRARKESGIDVAPELGAVRMSEILGHPPCYRGTTHISVADGDGNLAALTASNGEGCGHLIPGTGIMLNNMLGEEDLNATGLMAWPANRRLSSMMAPGIVRTDDGTRSAFGSGGSNRIRTALTQVVAGMVFEGLDPCEAVGRGRLHLEDGVLNAEPGIDPAILEGVLADEETLRLWPARNMFFGGAHIISLHADGRFDGAGDPRRDGVFERA